MRPMQPRTMPPLDRPADAGGRRFDDAIAAHGVAMPDDGIPGLPSRTRAGRSPVLSRAATAALTRAAVWAAVAVALLGYAQLFRPTYVDDAYITLQYARNLAEHMTWGFYPDRISNTATSPLNVIALAAADRVWPGETVTAVAPLTAGIWTATLAILLRISRRLTDAPHVGLLAAVGLLTSPLLLSAIGLEGYLFALLMLVSVERLLAGRPGHLGVALALLTLTRPDGVLLAGLMLLVVSGGRRARLQLVVAAVATAAPWYLFSWFYLGSFVPDTLILKLEDNAWAPSTFADGLFLYRDRFPIASLVSLWPVVLLPLVPLALRRLDAAGRLALGVLAGYAVIHYAAYAAMGVPPFHWYYTSEIVALVVLGALGGSVLLRGLTTSTDRTDRWVGMAATALPAAGLLGLLWVQGTPLRAAPIMTNWSEPSGYVGVGDELRGLIADGDVVELHGEIGTVAYACGDCILVDRFADLNRTTVLAEEMRHRETGLIAFLLRANFFWRDDLPALALPTYVLGFNPVALGAPAPVDGPDTVTSWNLTSPWIRGTTHVALRTATNVTLDVTMMIGPGGAVPPPLEPRVGRYTVSTIDASGGNPVPIAGEWTLGQLVAVPAVEGSRVIIRIEHPSYLPVELTLDIHHGENRVAVQYPGLPAPTPPAP